MFAVRDIVVFSVIVSLLASGMLAIWPWTRRDGRFAVAGIAAYYGRFPVARTLVIVAPGTAPETEGVTLGDGGPAIGTTEPHIPHAGISSFEGVGPKTVNWRSLGGGSESAPAEPQITAAE